jgi:hypothetical protein
MNVDVFAQRGRIVVCLVVILVGLTVASESEKPPAIEFRSLAVVPGFDKTRAGAVAEATAFRDWPKTRVCRMAPAVDKPLLSRPELVTRDSVSYTVVQFGREPWASGKWSWDALVESKKPVPKELPPELKTEAMKRVSTGQKDDPAFVDRYLSRKLKRYQMSQKYRLEGQMAVEMTLAPNSAAAQEYLLAATTNNTLPTEILGKMYAGAKRPEGLGTLSFLTESRNADDVNVRFVRDNICLNVWANGSLAAEALPLARKIDAMIARQPKLTLTQLTSRRPSVTVSPKPGERKTVSYEVSVPAGQELVRVDALIDGQWAAAKDGTIDLSGRKGRVTVRVTAITSALLAGSAERDLVVAE